MKPSNKKKGRKEKVWWLRKGGEGFSVRNLWMNGANARMVCAGNNQNDPKANYKVIPCEITYKI